MSHLTCHQLSQEKQQTSKSHQSKLFDDLPLNAQAQGEKQTNKNSKKQNLLSTRLSLEYLQEGQHQGHLCTNTPNTSNIGCSWIRNSVAIDAVPLSFKSAMMCLAWISILHLTIPENPQVCTFPTGIACCRLQKNDQQHSSS